MEKQRKEEEKGVTFQYYIAVPLHIEVSELLAVPDLTTPSHLQHQRPLHLGYDRMGWDGMGPRR